MTTETDATLCACGEPLHYTSQEVKSVVDDMVKRLGPEVQVVVAGQPCKKFMVQRHYIALHGLKAEALPELVEKGIIREAREADQYIKVGERPPESEIHRKLGRTISRMQMSPCSLHRVPLFITSRTPDQRELGR